MLLESLLRLAPDFTATPWQVEELSPLLTHLVESGKPLKHPAVGLLDQATLDSLFRP